MMGCVRGAVVPMRGVATWSLPYRAPELCLGEFSNYPVDVWAHGCMLEEVAHRRRGFHGKSDYDVRIHILKRCGTPKPPHALATRWRAHANITPSRNGVGCPTYEPVKLFKGNSTQCRSLWQRFRHRIALMR